MISLAIGAVIGGEGSGASASADRAGSPADPSPTVSAKGAHPSRGYFYADMITGRKVWRLDGPFATEEEAREALPAARRLAVDMIATAAFALFGTMRTDDDRGPGCLTAKLRAMS